MERFLGLLEGEEAGPVPIAPANLFDGVKMESWRSTLRRAAIIFAGRIPTEEEYESIRGATVNEFRAAIRNLMQGPEFHEFLIRVSNDRLLTDREAVGDRYVIDPRAGFVDFTNLHADYHSASQLSQPAFDEFIRWRNATNYGFARAPLELIAHVVENELPYTEILTADYIMGNPLAAEAYGAATAFDSPDDVHEFRPSQILSYYREDDSKVVDESDRDDPRVVHPGNLLTEYPHAGILNTTVFMLRYPTTPTNRNRARSRWTYYHFLGVDIEKSASRTTDPVALADTNNPTMNNPACTVCHSVLDPVAGAFQNYSNEGYYRNAWGGLDSLDDFYKSGTATLNDDYEVTARSWSRRQTLPRDAVLSRGEQSVRLMVVYETRPENDNWSEVGLDHLTLRDADGDVVRRYELEHSDSDCGGPQHNEETGREDWFRLRGMCPLVVAVDVPADGAYRIDVAAWVVDQAKEIEGAPATLEVAVDFYREGDTWYRDMRDPGFDGVPVPNADASLPWLANEIVGDPRFAAATVKFWWPAIMGAHVATAPEEADDADFEGLLLASNAQAAEVERLARGFRRGFRGRMPYDLKDLLVEIVLSKWFRAAELTERDPVREVALRDAGAERLLAPEELARKTAAVTGYSWGRNRHHGLSGTEPHKQRASHLTDGDHGYRLLYGGIDSDGNVTRVEDITSVMAGIAKSHAMESSCAVVLREFYLLSDDRRYLFDGIDRAVSPVWELSGAFEIKAGSWSERETLALTGPLPAGEITVALTFTNDYADAGGDRNLKLDRLDVRDPSGNVVTSRELESLEAGNDCDNQWHDHFSLNCSGSLDVPFTVPVQGNYTLEVVAWADQHGDELAELEVVASSSDTSTSRGGALIRAKLVELHNKLLGVDVTAGAPDVTMAYDLFVDVWRRQRAETDPDSLAWLHDARCPKRDLYYYEEVVGDSVVLVTPDDGPPYYEWDHERINEFEYEQDGGVDFSDRHHVARTWIVVLAALLMDYRYLYL